MKWYHLLGAIVAVLVIAVVLLCQRPTNTPKAPRVVVMTNYVVIDSRLLFMNCGVCEPDKRPGAMVLSYYTKGTKQPAMGSPSAKQPYWFVKTENAETRIPEGAIAFYDNESGKAEVLAEKWDIECIMDEDCKTKFITDLLAKLKKQDHPR